jgi:hypothetical protein
VSSCSLIHLDNLYSNKKFCHNVHYRSSCSLWCSSYSLIMCNCLFSKVFFGLWYWCCMLCFCRKYEEICAPQVEEFCYITDNTYRREEVSKWVLQSCKLLWQISLFLLSSLSSIFVVENWPHSVIGILGDDYSLLGWM